MALNRRFRRHPYSCDGWATLADCAVLVHNWDAWEDHQSPWRAVGQDQSCSLIHAGQHTPGRGPPRLLPLYTPAGAGVIFRPGATPILCAKGADSGGHCDVAPTSQNWCPHVDPSEVVTEESVRNYGFPGDGCRGQWRPADFGKYLERQATWQRRYGQLEHNEIVIEGRQWDGALPGLIEAFFVSTRASDHDIAYTRDAYARFNAAWPQPVQMSPLLVRLDPAEWERPFSLFGDGVSV